MKRFFTVLALLLFAACGFAQDTIPQPAPLREFMPDARDFGVTANLTGLIGNLGGNTRKDLRGTNAAFVRYTINDRMTFRTGIAPTLMNVRHLNTDSVGKDLVEYDSTARQSSISISPGMEFHLRGTKRLDPYVAVDAEVGLIGKFSAGVMTNISDTTGTATIRRTLTEAGGYSWGARLGFGMNYFLAKRFALGMEYGLGVRSLITGGDRQDVTQTDPVSGAETTVRVLSSTRTTDTGFYVDPTVMFTISYFFGFK